jgi:hypothetical protein
MTKNGSKAGPEVARPRPNYSLKDSYNAGKRPNQSPLNKQSLKMLKSMGFIKQYFYLSNFLN